MRIRSRIHFFGICILLPLLLPAASAPAANQNVTAQSSGPNNTFTPKAVTINAGDTVTWTNNSGFHNVHFDDNSFIQPASPAFPPWTVSRTFPSAGTFRYYCDAHGGPNGSGMSGTVWVEGPGYPRPLSASPVKTSLGIAYKPCPAASANRTHGPPLVHPSCNPPAQASDWLTVGTFDANGQNANSVGSVALRVVTGDPANPPDDADVRLSASVTDVRNKAGLADYAGELQVKLPLRITDKQSGPAADERATGSTTFNFTVPCVVTGAAGVGSTCSVTTTADSVIPGSVLEAKRAVWQVEGVQVFDGGSDGVASTAGNTLFASQGLFVP